MAVAARSVPISKIRLSDGTQTRVKTDPDVVADYAEHAQELPQAEGEDPIVLFTEDEEAYWPGAGHHRIPALASAGYEHIKADVRKGTQRDAKLYSLGSNAAHGLQRTRADKRHMIEALLEDDEWSQWSSRAIADHLHVSHPLVEEVRAGKNGQMGEDKKSTGKISSTRTSKSGKQVPASRGPKCPKCAKAKERDPNCAACKKLQDEAEKKRTAAQFEKDRLKQEQAEKKAQRERAAREVKERREAEKEKKAEARRLAAEQKAREREEEKTRKEVAKAQRELAAETRRKEREAMATGKPIYDDPKVHAAIIGLSRLFNDRATALKQQKSLLFAAVRQGMDIVLKAWEAWRKAK